MEEKVKLVFFKTFWWFDCSDFERLYNKMKDDIITDITECADEDFNEDDVRIAIRRVMFKQFDID